MDGGVAEYLMKIEELKKSGKEIDEMDELIEFVKKRSFDLLNEEIKKCGCCPSNPSETPIYYDGRAKEANIDWELKKMDEEFDKEFEELEKRMVEPPPKRVKIEEPFYTNE